MVGQHSQGFAQVMKIALDIHESAGDEAHLLGGEAPRTHRQSGDTEGFCGAIDIDAPRVERFEKFIECGFHVFPHPGCSW
jgi:hypothetical protein